jgi:hypothetical protein
MANWYAREHLKTDPGVDAIYFLPEGAPDREIRFLEVNKLIAERRDDTLEPIDFGVNRGMEDDHVLLVLDVTPGQWERIQNGSLVLPPGWSLKSKVQYPRS